MNPGASCWAKDWDQLLDETICFCIFHIWFLSWSFRAERINISCFYISVFLCVAIHVPTYMMCNCVSVGVCAYREHVLTLATSWTCRNCATAGWLLMNHLIWQPLTIPTHKTTTLPPFMHLKIRFTWLNIYLEAKEKHFEELEADTTDFFRGQTTVIWTAQDKAQMQRTLQHKMKKSAERT